MLLNACSAYGCWFPRVPFLSILASVQSWHLLSFSLSPAKCPPLRDLVVSLRVRVSRVRSTLLWTRTREENVRRYGRALVGFNATSHAAHGRWHTTLRLRPTSPIGHHASQPVPTAPAQPKLDVECLSAESSPPHGGRLAPRNGRISTEPGHGQLLDGRDEYVGIPALVKS